MEGASVRALRSWFARLGSQSYPDSNVYKIRCLGNSGSGCLREIRRTRQHALLAHEQRPVSGRRSLSDLATTTRDDSAAPVGKRRRGVARHVRVALLSQGVLYLAAATISTVNVSLFLDLVHRPGVNAFQAQITGLLYGAIGLVVLIAGLLDAPPPAAALAGCAGAAVTAVIEAFYLPYWSFIAHPRFTSSLWVDLPYETALAIVLAPLATSGIRDAAWLRWDRATLRSTLLPVAVISVAIALAGLVLYLLAR